MTDLINLDGVPVLVEEEGVDLVGDREIYYELIGEFLSLSEKQVEELQKAVETGDYETIILRSHSIKGSSANLSLKRVNRIAAAIEKHSRQQDPVDYTGYVSLLVEELKELGRVTG